MANYTDTDNADATMNGTPMPPLLKKVIDLRKNQPKPFADMDLDKTQDWGGLGGSDGTSNGSAQPNNTNNPSKPVVQTNENVEAPWKSQVDKEGFQQAPKVPGVNASIDPSNPAQSDMDLIKSGVQNEAQSAQANLPTLAHQGSNNKFLRFFQKGMGIVGDQPKPGQLYNTPEEQAQHRAGLGQVFKGIGELGLGMAAGGGGQHQQQQAMQALIEQPKLDLQRANVTNEMEHRKHLEDEASERARISQQNADNQGDRTNIMQQRANTADSGLNLKGQMTGYKKQVDGSWRPMTADEYAQDPRLKNVPALQNAALQLKQQETELTRLRQGNYDVNSPIFKQHEADIQSRLALTREGINAGLERAEILAGPRAAGVAATIGGKAEQIWKLPLDSGKQLQNMRQSYQDVVHGNQQAAVNLLANHIGMTIGSNQTRATQSMWYEAQQSDSALRRIQAHFDENGYLQGVVLSPEQAAQMVNLGEQKYRQNVQEARQQSEYFSQLTGQPIGEPQLQIDPDTPVGGGPSNRPTKGHAQQLPIAGGGNSSPVPKPLSKATNSTKTNGYVPLP